MNRRMRTRMYGGVRGRGLGAPSYSIIQETAYPRLKNNYTQKELNEVYTPSPEELKWAQRNTRGDVANLGLLVMLKISQRLGYFVAITDIPESIIQHIARVAGIIRISSNDWNTYNESSTHKRHRALIRDYRGIRFFDTKARQIMFNAMAEVALIKDEPADLINVAIERLIQQKFELPVFNTLVETARHMRAKSYRDLYEHVYHALGEGALEAIDDLFRTSSRFSYTPWHRMKQDAGNPTLTHLKELVSHHEWLSRMNVGIQALQGVPISKVKQMAAEAKTLDASRMLEMESRKRSICRHQISQR